MGNLVNDWALAMIKEFHCNNAIDLTKLFCLWNKGIIFFKQKICEFVTHSVRIFLWILFLNFFNMIPSSCRSVHSFMNIKLSSKSRFIFHYIEKRRYDQLGYFSMQYWLINSNYGISYKSRLIFSPENWDLVSTSVFNSAL